MTNDDKKINIKKVNPPFIITCPVCGFTFRAINSRHSSTLNQTTAEKEKDKIWFVRGLLSRSMGYCGFTVTEQIDLWSVIEKDIEAFFPV